jgi:mono/diheme cytochrome c family protein
MQTQPVRVAEYARHLPVDLGAGSSFGRHLAMTHCSECHGPSLEGGEPEPGATAPDLTVASAYDLPAFTKLLRSGAPLGGRKLRQMDVVARAELAYLTDEEIAAIHAYLIERAQRVN